MQGGESRDGDVHNIFHGSAEIVVQFRDNYGDVHIQADARSQSPLETAARVLAETAFRQWREEVKVWDVGGDRPTLAVRWKPRDHDTSRPGPAGVFASPAGVRPDEFITGFLGLEPRRMVILGEPGAGKTSLAALLTLELLRKTLEQRAGERSAPVPILLTLTSWNPYRENFSDWLVRRLAEDYPGLPRIDGRHPARELWATSRPVLLPVLDGLDEMPPDRRTAAVKALNDALYERMPVILTCRTTEFDEATANPDEVTSKVMLRDAVVVVAQPVSVAEAVKYFSSTFAPIGQLGRWQPLFEHLHEHPRGPVASALSTPLMIWLCRTAYAGVSSNPERLADRTEFRSRLEVEEHLLDRFVPAAFTGELPSGDRRDPPRRWAPDLAHRCLRTFAAQLQRQDSTELAWWRLERTPLAWVLVLPLLVLLGIFISEMAVLLGAAARQVAGPGLTGGIGAGFGDGLGGPGIAGSLGGGALLAFALRVVVSIWYGEVRLSEPRRRASLLRPVAALRSAAQASTWWKMLLSGCGALLLAGVSVLLTSVWTGSAPLLAAAGGFTFLAAVVAVIFTAPAGTGEATTPMSLLRAEHHAVLLTAGVIGPLLGLAIAASWFSQPAVVVLANVVLAWLGVLSLLVLISPWSRWLMAKLSLALTRQAPWLLSRFLQDAHRQGVLRQFGGTYQFRSVRLQQRLAQDVPEGRVARLLAGPGGRPQLAPDAITFTSDAGTAFRLRIRRVSLAPLVASLPLAGILTVRIAVLQGTHSLGLVWVPPVFILGLAALISGVTWLRPRAVLDLRIDRTRIECFDRRNRGARYEWADVEEVAFRRIHRRSREIGRYGIQVRLAPGSKVPPKAPRSDGSWHVVCILGLQRRLPWEIEKALGEFGAERWRSPVLAPVNSRLRVRLDAHGDDFDFWERQMGLRD